MKAYLALTLFTAGLALAQQSGGPPSVTDLVAELDQNEDGKISKEEADGSARGKRQFARWDRDQDGFATRDEIIAMRRKSGIDAEGNRIAGRRGREQSPAKLTIPCYRRHYPGRRWRAPDQTGDAVVSLDCEDRVAPRGEVRLSHCDRSPVRRLPHSPAPPRQTSQGHRHDREGPRRPFIPARRIGTGSPRTCRKCIPASSRSLPASNPTEKRC